MPYTYPPAAPTVSGDFVTASRFLNATPLVARRLRTLAEQRFVSLRVLTGRASTTSGSLQLEQSENMYADRPVEVVSPGGEYPLTTLSTGPIQQVSTQKWGEDTEFYDEALSRMGGMGSVERGLTKMVNSAAKNIDGIGLSLIASTVTQTQGTGGTLNWTATGTPPTILRDILTAKATLAALNQGYDPDVLLINDATWAAVASDPTLINSLRRENPSNPVYSGDLVNLAGVDILPTPNLPAAGGWLIDSKAFGGMVVENLGGSYQSAGELLETKSMRKDDVDGWRVRVRSVFAPYIVEPNAAIKINNAI
jgi:hypothetical protein